jgi:hypothetical protein
VSAALGIPPAVVQPEGRSAGPGITKNNDSTDGAESVVVGAIVVEAMVDAAVDATVEEVSTLVDTGTDDVEDDVSEAVHAESTTTGISIVMTLRQGIGPPGKSGGQRKPIPFCSALFNGRHCALCDIWQHKIAPASGGSGL